MNPYNDKPRMFWKNFHSLFGERYIRSVDLLIHCLWTLYFYSNGGYVYFSVFRFSLKSLVSILDYETWQPRRKVYDPCFKKR